MQFQDAVISEIRIRLPSAKINYLSDLCMDVKTKRMYTSIYSIEFNNLCYKIFISHCGISLYVGENLNTLNLIDRVFEIAEPSCDVNKMIDEVVNVIKMNIKTASWIVER